jgi:spore coat polysaccharide biosynthesis protein SpsF
VTPGKTAILLQARFGSRRLPGKALLRLGGATLLGHCLSRLRVAAVGPIVLATTRLDEDDALAEEARLGGAAVYRGEAEDVLGRMVEAAGAVGAEFVIRATGDNPAVDLLSSLRVLEALRAGRGDHAVEEGLPYGCTVEAVRVSALRTAAAAATASADREHVTTYIRRQPSVFRCLTIPAPRSVSRPDLRFTVDTRADLDYLRRVFRVAGTGGEQRPQPLETLIAAAGHVAAVDQVAVPMRRIRHA